MSTQNIPVYNRYLGNGAATLFSVGFPYLDEKFVKVYLFRGATQEEVLLDDTHYRFTNSKTIEFPILDSDAILGEGDILTIQRETDLGNPFEFDNQRRLFPDAVMKADDLEAQQIQELARDVKRSLKVSPTDGQGPDELWQEFKDGVQSAQNNAVASEASAIRSEEAAKSAENAVDGFDQHVEDAKTTIDQFTGMKIDEIDDHALVVEQNFDSNAAIKQGEVDASALEAANSAREAEISRIAAKASEEECKRLVESLGVIFVFKGTVPTFNNLPMVGNANGDVYRVLDQAVFYVWVDTEWQNLGGLIDISSLVTINTDQEIDAHKTFLKDMGITSKDIDTITDKNTRLQGLGYYDKNGLRGAVYPYVGASGNVELRLMASTGNASSFGAMGVTADGNPYMYAPKPPKESDDDSVATTDWVNEKDSEIAHISNSLLTGNVSTNAEGYADVLKMNSSVAEHKYDVIESSISADNEGWHTGELTAIDIDVTKQFKFSIGFRVTGFPHEQGLFNFVSESGEPNSCLVIDKDQKIKCRFSTTDHQHLEEINYVINPNYEYRVTWEYDKYVGYTINIYDGATLVKSQIINDTAPIDGDSLRTLQFGIGYNSGTKLEGQLKGDFIQAYSEDNLVYAPHLAIHYRLSTYGTKIADVEYRDVVTAMYSLKGYAPYYTIDTVNRNYTLPMGNIYRYDEQKAEKNNVLNKQMITNCITEIPQDIKLEFKNGTLTLKAGSKVYDGNGLLATTTRDSATRDGGATTQPFIVYVPSTNSILNALKGDTVSSLPTNPKDFKVYYNTTDKKCYVSRPEGWVKCSFPIVEATTKKGEGVQSIDQVFNGFGYIGSTVFALPGVKGLIPDGRNEDGSLKNKELVNPLYTRTVAAGYHPYHSVSLATTGIGINNNYYDSQKNILYNEQDQEQTDRYVVANIDIDSAGRITSFQPKIAFHALDYSDKSEISGWGMPSDRHVNLSLGASGSYYVAPANGYFYFGKRSSAQGTYILLKQDGGIQYIERAPTDNVSLFVNCPAKRGDKVQCIFTSQGETEAFRFYYAEGEK